MPQAPLVVVSISPLPHPELWLLMRKDRTDSPILNRLYAPACFAAIGPIMGKTKRLPLNALNTHASQTANQPNSRSPQISLCKKYGRKNNAIPKTIPRTMSMTTAATAVSYTHLHAIQAQWAAFPLRREFRAEDGRIPRPASELCRGGRVGPEAERRECGWNRPSARCLLLPGRLCPAHGPRLPPGYRLSLIHI